MEYIYINKKWKNLSTNTVEENFDSSKNNKRIKLYNRYPGINNRKGYSYIDPEDILFIWSDGTLYGECSTDRSSSSFNIKPEYIVNFKKAKKLINDAPGAIMNYILKYVDILMRSPDFWLKSNAYFRTVDREKIYELLNVNVERILTQEQQLAYELRKNEIGKMIDDYEKQNYDI